MYVVDTKCNRMKHLHLRRYKKNLDPRRSATTHGIRWKSVELSDQSVEFGQWLHRLGRMSELSSAPHLVYWHPHSFCISQVQLVCLFSNVDVFALHEVANCNVILLLALSPILHCYLSANSSIFVYWFSLYDHVLWLSDFFLVQVLLVSLYSGCKLWHFHSVAPLMYLLHYISHRCAHQVYALKVCYDLGDLEPCGQGGLNLFTGFGGIWERQGHIITGCCNSIQSIERVVNLALCNCKSDCATGKLHVAVQHAVSTVLSLTTIGYAIGRCILQKKWWTMLIQVSRRKKLQ